MLPDGDDRRKITSRKVIDPGGDLGEAGDSLVIWTQRYGERDNLGRLRCER